MASNLHESDLKVVKYGDNNTDASPSKAVVVKDDGKGASRLLKTYVDHVLLKAQDPPQTQVALNRLTEHFHESTFEEKLDSIELRNIPFKSQISIQRNLVPSLSTDQKKRFIMIAKRIKDNDASLIQIKLANEGIDDFVLYQLCAGLTYNNRLQYLILHNNCITDEGVKRLCAVLSCHPKFHTLWLSANKISDVGVRALARLTAKNPNIKEINLSNRWPSQIWAQKEYELRPHVTYIGAEYLSQALRAQAQLTSLTLAEQRLRDDGAILLFEVLSECILRALNISANELTNRCCESLRDVLAANPVLEKLVRPLICHTLLSPSTPPQVLSKNTITDTGAVAIAHGIKYNTNLNTLDLSDNLIEDKGMIVLFRAIEKKQTLSSCITVGNPAHDHRAELIAATRNASVFAKSGQWRNSLLMELKSIDSNGSPDRNRPQTPLTLLGTADSASPRAGAVAKKRNTRASFAEVNVSPFRKSAAPGSMVAMAGVEAHGRKGLTRSVLATSNAIDESPRPKSAANDFLAAIAKAVEYANTHESEHRPVNARDNLSLSSSSFDGFAMSSTNSVSVDVIKKRRLSQDLGKVLGVPQLQHIGVKPIRSKVSDYGDSREHMIYLRIATEDDPADARPYSLVRIGLDHREERQRMLQERQSGEYKKMKAIRLKEKPKQLIKETAPPPVPKQFWQYWRRKTKLAYPKGIDHSRGCSSIRLDPVVLPAQPVVHEEEEAGDSAIKHRRDSASSLGSMTVAESKKVIKAADPTPVAAPKKKGNKPEPTEEEARAAAVAALQSLYDHKDADNPWNRYIAFKEDALKPLDERRLGYYRHLGFTGRYFSPGQVLAARRKEKAIQLGLLAEKPSARALDVEELMEPSKTITKQASSSTKADFVTSSLALHIAASNRLR